MRKNIEGDFLVVDNPLFAFPIDEALWFAEKNEIIILKSDLQFASELMAFVSKFTTIPASIISLKSRDRDLSGCRALFWYFLMTRTHTSMETGAALVNRKDHTVVIHGMKTFEQYLVGNTTRIKEIPYQNLVRLIRNQLGHLHPMNRGLKNLEHLIALEYNLLGSPILHLLVKKF